MVKSRAKLMILNAFSVLAYLACALLWLVTALPFVTSAAKSEVFLQLSGGSPHTEPTPVVVSGSGFPSWMAIAFSISVAVLMLVMLVLMLKRLPQTVGTAGQKVTRKTAEHIVPVVTHHHKLSPRKRLELTARIIFDIKLAVVALPVIIVLVVPLPPGALVPRDILLFVVGVTAGWALLLFCLQIALSRALKVDLSQLW